jgi:zinc-binding alcohol dehydrogenase family protein
MKAVGHYKYLPSDHPEALLDVSIDAPEPQGRDLLVEVKAISVNPVDTKRRAAGNRPDTELKVLGWDATGVVQAIGPQVELFKPGDKVYYAGSNQRPGANSQLHVVDERIVGRKPGNLSFAEAAAMPLTTITAWEALFERMSVSKSGAHAGRRLLILGGAGGVGAWESSAFGTPSSDVTCQASSVTRRSGYSYRRRISGRASRTAMPSSSASSRLSPANESSPESSLPPGNSQRPAMCRPRGRWAISTRP